ncbi:MAG TPA: PIN domain-containing protein [Candidatus Nanoarchaeia archaeon]|nr:PIN domain-containing protein [Candidatus Nanoarchaeia archaeon]
MIIVLDSNILFAALIKNSTVRSMIYQLNTILVMPEVVLDAIRRYKHDLAPKPKLTEDDFEEILRLLLNCVRIIPNEQILPYRNEAWELVKDHSPEDVMFIACALAFESSILWSDDKKLKRQNKVTVLNTSEILKILNNRWSAPLKVDTEKRS